MTDQPDHADTGRMETCSTCGVVKNWWEAWSTGQCDPCYLAEHPISLARPGPHAYEPVRPAEVRAERCLRYGCGLPKDAPIHGDHSDGLEGA